MTGTRLSVAVAALAIMHGTASGQDHQRQLTVLMSVGGTCSELTMAGTTVTCQGALLHTEYDDGRIGFYFLEEPPAGRMVSFSGLGQEQQAPSETVRIQPIDAVILADGISQASGECLFENPYAGPARIWCAARSATGASYVGRFVTDGNAPRMLDIGGKDG